MVTGGREGAWRWVDVFDPRTNVICPGYSLPDNREEHTTGQSPPPVSPLNVLFIADLTDVGLVTCGGEYTKFSCIRLPAPGAGVWLVYNQLIHNDLFRDMYKFA